MEKCLRMLMCAMLLFINTSAQILPAENAIINYRLAGFSVPENTKAVSYLFQVAKGIQSDGVAFNKAVVVKNKSASPRSIMMLPSFQSPYTWRVTYYDKAGHETGKTELCHFFTGMISAVDTSLVGLSVMTKASHHKDMLLMLDAVFVIYDMAGKPVWYMPELQGVIQRGIELRDFKPTADGTFTFLTPNGGYEMDYYGNLLWSTPGKSEMYHHEFTKLTNGHYMIASAETIKRKIPADPDVFFLHGDTSVTKGDDGKYYKSFTSGNIIEYDGSGNVVWTWKSAEHFADKDFFRPRKALAQPFDSRTYLNGFDFDEENKVLYVSFKNINRVVKIQYPSGNIIAEYGEVVNGDWSIQGHSPFYGEHTCRVDKKTNQLYLYNNNYSDNKNVMLDEGLTEQNYASHISVYSQNTAKGTIEKVWDYACKLQLPRGVPTVTTRGGSVIMLEDKCMLVNMGTLNHLMLVSADKKLVWDAAPYVSNIIREKRAMTPYRCNYINMKDIEKFIFNNKTTANSAHASSDE